MFTKASLAWAHVIQDNPLLASLALNSTHVLCRWAAVMHNAKRRMRRANGQLECTPSTCAEVDDNRGTHSSEGFEKGLVLNLPSLTSSSTSKYDTLATSTSLYHFVKIAAITCYEDWW